MSRAEQKDIYIKFQAETKDVTAELRQLQKNAYSLDTQLRNLKTALKFDPTNVSNYSNVMVKLSERIQDQRAIVQGYTEKLETAKTLYGDSSNTVQNLTNSLEKEQTKLTALEAEYKATSTATSEFKEKSEAASVALGTLAAKAIEKLVSKLTELGKKFVETGETYEDSINGLAAVMEQGASSDQLSTLSDRFRDLALNSRYSASEMANNAQVLANAGYSYQQISDAIEPIQNLAEGTGEDFATMANVVADGLHSFGLEAKDATKFSDILAKSAISSNTDVTQMGEAFKYAGTVAGTFGYSVSDVAVALGTMASSGIKGTQAGTALRSMITRLGADVSGARSTMEQLGVAFYDADGKARPLMDVFDDLRKVMSGMTQDQKVALEYTIAGQRGITGLAAIVNASATDWNNLKEAVAGYDGTVKGMKETRLDTLSGDVDKLQHSWQELALEVYEKVSPSMREIVQELTDVANSKAFKMSITRKVRELSSSIKGIAKVAVGSSSGIASLITQIADLSVTASATALVSKLTGKLTELAMGLGTTSTAFAALGAKLAVISPWLTLITLGIGLVKTSADAMSDAFKDSHPYLEQFTEDHESLKQAIEDSNDALKESVSSATSEYDRTQRMISELDDYVYANGRVKKGYEERVSYILGQLSDSYGVEAEMIGGQITNYGDLIEQVNKLSDAQLKQHLVEAASEKYEASLQAQSDALQLQTDAYTSLAAEAENYLNILSQHPEQQLQGVLGQNVDWQGTIDDWNALNEAQKINILLSGDLSFANKETLDNITSASETLNDATADVISANDMMNTVLNGSLDQARAALSEFSSSTAQEYDGTVQLLQAYASEYQTLSDQYSTATDERKELILGMMDEIRGKFDTLKDELGDEANGITLPVNTEQTNTDIESGLEIIKENAKTAASTAGTEAGTTMSDSTYSALSAQNTVNQETALVEADEDGTEIGDEYETSISDGITDSSEGTSTAAQSSAQTVVDTTKETMSSDTARSIAIDWIQGLINGLNDKTMQAKLRAAAKSTSKIVDDQTRATTGSNSPSVIAKEIGGDWDEGLILGLDAKKQQLASKADEVASVVNRAMTAGAYGIGGASSYYNSRQTTVNQSLTFNGQYQARDGQAIIRDLDRRLGEASL